MLQSPTNDHLLRLSMLLLRKFLKFPKFKKLPYNHYLNRFINNLSENVTKVPKIPKNPKMPICSGHMLTDKYLLEFSKCKKFQNISCDICTWNRWDNMTDCYKYWKEVPKIHKIIKNWIIFLDKFAKSTLAKFSINLSVVHRNTKDS